MNEYDDADLAITAIRRAPRCVQAVQADLEVAREAATKQAATVAECGTTAAHGQHRMNVYLAQLEYLKRDYYRVAQLQAELAAKRVVA